MDQLIRRMRGENRFTPREKINEGEADEMVIPIVQMQIGYFKTTSALGAITL